jgi:hypothetical protein
MMCDTQTNSSLIYYYVMINYLLGGRIKVNIDMFILYQGCFQVGLFLLLLFLIHVFYGKNIFIVGQRKL